VVISGSGGSIKTYLLFFIINLCKIFDDRYNAH
jgi:hypothetical protein